MSTSDFDHQEFPLEPPRKEWPRARGKECVLVAEDSESLRDLMLAMLSGLGYEVLTAGGGHEAMRQIERHHGVDLVITDAIMPRGGGFQIVDEMGHKWPATPILITSGYTDEIQAGLKERLQRRSDAAAAAAEEAKDDPPSAEAPARAAKETKETAEAGALAAEATEAADEDDDDPEAAPLVEFLPKPFTPEQLARLVRDILDRSKGLVPRGGRA